MEIKYVVTRIILFNSLCEIQTKDTSFNYSADEIHSIGHIHFTIIDKIMCAYELLNSILHNFNVQIATGKEIFIASSVAPISSIELFTNWLTS